MKITDAVPALAALAQETRLAIFRLLVKAGPQGLAAGTIAAKVGVPGATLSFHIAQLVRAGLVTARPDSRYIYYAADFTAMDDLLSFLTDHCCGGQACLPKTTGTAAPARRRKAA